ncbi:MAG: type II toxin-antitoxin system VapC family toxin [Acidobacteriota bacterium]
MKLLLDTHVWLWSLLQPDNLTARVREALLDADNELWLSPISVCEALVLHERGRIELADDPDAWVQRALLAAPMREAPITHEIARRSRRLPLDHRDPADRFLAATAVVLELVLVTADRRLIGHPSFRTLANR